MHHPRPSHPPRQWFGVLTFAFAVQLAPLRSEPENPPVHTADLHAAATARINRWFETDDYAANLLRYELGAIFRDWGRRDLPGAEAFIRELRWTPCDSSDPNDMRVALHYATLIGASTADPALAWRMLLLHEITRDGQFVRRPAGEPHLFEITARLLFQTYHHADPKAAAASLRQVPRNLIHIAAPAWAVVLTRTPDTAARADLYGEMPRNFQNSPAVLAGLAEVDPLEAWQRIQKIPLADGVVIDGNCRRYAGMQWIKTWAYHQPEQALRFLATLEMDDETQTLHEECFSVLIHHHPAYITRSMEALHGKLRHFNFDSFSDSLRLVLPCWRILDGPPPLSPVERFTVFAATLGTADLPQEFKTRLLKFKLPPPARQESIIPRAMDEAEREAESAPMLITQLKFIGEESLTWAIRPGFPDEKNHNNFHFIDGLGNRNRAVAGPDDIFFAEEPAAGRFKLLGHEVREIFNERIGKNEFRTFARVEDQRPHKSGVVYEIPAPLAGGAIQQHQQFDRSAIFTLDAANPNADKFQIEEFATFTLPPGGEGPTYKLVSVNADEVMINFTDAEGKSWAVTLPKLGLAED